MLRKILAGLVVAVFLLGGSFALASASEGHLTYQPAKVDGQMVVKLYLENPQGLAATGIPISFGKPGSDIICTEVSFEGSRVEHFLHWVQKDNQNKKVLIGAIRALDEQILDQLQPGEGLFATLKFESKSSSCKPQLSVTYWQLQGDKLYFHMADAAGTAFYNEPIEDKQGDRPVPLRPGSAEEPTVVPRPSEFNLLQNFPNPFNPETVIKFSVKENSWVTLRVYNVLGQVVRTLVDEPKSAGEYAVPWDGKNGQNEEVASGVYFYRIKAGDYESVRRMTLLR
jgi:hypothetical protein